jgi:anti-sigma factor RsiW
MAKVDCASSDRHTVRPWFNGKLDYSPPVPDLSQAGYTLKGGRIDMLDRRAVAAIVYEHGEHVINLSVWPAGDRKIDIDLQSQRGYNYCAGNISGFNYFCISDMSGSDLEAFEDEVREHLNL